MKKLVISVFLTAVFCFIQVTAQIKKEAARQYWYTEAMRLYRLDEPTTGTDSTSLSLFLKYADAAGVYSPLGVQCLINAGNIHQGYQRFAEANALYRRAIHQNEKYVKKEAFAYEACLYLGSSFYFSNIIDSAQYYLETASNIAMNYRGKDVLPEKSTLYNSLGAIYYESANYLQAKNYFELANKFIPASVTAADYTELYNSYQSNIANCLMKLNYFDSALRVFKSLNPQAQQKNIIRQNTAHSYFETGNYDSALQIYQSLTLKNDFTGVVALTDMGRIYMNRNQFKQAEAIFDTAIARNKRISTTIKNKEEALAYLYRSKLAEKQGLLDEAVGWVNEALQEVHLVYKVQDAEDVSLDITKTVSPITLFNILHFKAELYSKKYLKSRQYGFLTTSLAAYRKAIETANFIKLSFDNDEAKLFFNKNYRTIYNEAVNVAYEAAVKNDRYANDYLFILENYKGNIIEQNLQVNLLKSSVVIPDSVKQREKELKQLLAVYTTRINQNTAESETRQLYEKLLSLQVELSRLQKKYEADENYKLYRFQSSDYRQSVKDVQQSIDGNTALVNYFYGDSTIYVLVITAELFSIKKINTDSAFRQSYRSFIEEVYQHEEGKRYEGLAVSEKLYDYLVKPVEQLAGNCKNWVIIPDGNLYYLPFEALVKNAARKDYLMLSRCISYHYSLTLLLGSTHHKPSGADAASIAFAPYFKTDSLIKKSGMAELPLSGQELNNVSDSVFLGSTATKKAFAEKAAGYPVIHLATHASISTDSNINWIQFYPSDPQDINNKLYVQEIYNLDLRKTELVILSACQTAGGAAVTGEGLLSLSRAFIYAGADGIVSTLWKTEDRVTSYLMQRMHIYLKQKMPPENALQQAKKDMLSNKELGAQYKTPNYWANFIYVGKLHADKTGKQSSYWFAIVTGVCVIAALLLVWVKRKKLRRFSDRIFEQAKSKFTSQ